MAESRRIEISEGLMGEIARFKVAADGLYVIEFRRISGQPFDGEPMARSAGAARLALLMWIRLLLSTGTAGLLDVPGLGPLRVDDAR